VSTGRALYGGTDKRVLFSATSGRALYSGIPSIPETYSVSWTGNIPVGSLNIFATNPVTVTQVETYYEWESPWVYEGFDTAYYWSRVRLYWLASPGIYELVLRIGWSGPPADPAGPPAVNLPAWTGRGPTDQDSAAGSYDLYLEGFWGSGTIDDVSVS